MDKTRAEHLPIEKLRPFEGHPFKVADNEEMDQLVESILAQGVLTPLVVRPLDNGEYEVISGHRRLHACKRAGIGSIPAVITEMDRDAAAIALVDSNLHREHILPSEKAFAFKMKRDALNRQGTSRQVGEKLSVTQISESTGDSERQVHRYIRLTNLIPGILQMVDDGRIALTPAVEISYLTNREQRELLETMECEDCTPSLSQAIQLKLLSQSGNLDIYTIFDILTQRKPNQQEKISFRTEDVRKFFPKSYTTAQMQDVILRLLEGYQRQRQRSQER
jgi:ParB family chromosome partitioning protein